MSPRTRPMLYSGPYPVPRAQPILTRNDPYSSSATSGTFHDSARHYSLSSAGAYTRIRHNQGLPWNNNNRTFFPDQATYTAPPHVSGGPFTMNPVDAIYSQSMIDGYETIAPLDTTANGFNHMIVAPAGRHQVFNEQDLAQDSVLPLEMNAFESYLSNGSAPYSRHTAWVNGQPSPVGSDCMLANPSITIGQLNRHGVPITDDLEITRDISPYELVDSDPFSRHSGMRCGPVQPRPIRSASDRQDSCSEDSYQGSSTRSSENVHENKKPRSDKHYNTGPGPDGLYRCPFYMLQDCNHKPTKQKCIFDKNLDSHLKPYKCTEPDCEDSSFSSNACLFRHQREAHGHHGHSAHLCHWSSCERAQPGNGFPRKWNLGDHMKRVHAYDMTKDSGDEPARKKRHDSSTVPMKRSTSSKDKVFPAPSVPYSRVDRHAARYNQQAYPAMGGYEACNVGFQYQEYDSMAYAHHSRHSQPVVGY